MQGDQPVARPLPRVAPSTARGGSRAAPRRWRRCGGRSAAAAARRSRGRRRSRSASGSSRTQGPGEPSSRPSPRRAAKALPAGALLQRRSASAASCRREERGTGRGSPARRRADRASRPRSEGRLHQLVAGAVVGEIAGHQHRVDQRRIERGGGAQQAAGWRSTAPRRAWLRARRSLARSSPERHRPAPRRAGVPGPRRDRRRRRWPP